MVAVGDHHPARQKAQAAFQRACVDVQHEDGYILPREQDFGEGDERRVIGAQQEFHGSDLGGLRTAVEAGGSDGVG